MSDPERLARIIADLAARSSVGLLRLWDALGSWDEAASDRFDSMAKPYLSTIAQASIDVTAAFAGTILDTPAGVSPLIVADAAARTWDPFDRLGRLLSEGVDWQQAISEARNVTQALGADTAYRTSRQAMADAASTAKGRWTRLATGKTCDWCLSFTVHTWPTASWATFGHDHCDCIVVPATPQVETFNRGLRESSGYTERAGVVRQKLDLQRNRTSLANSVTTARRHAERAAIERMSEADPARVARLARREQDWTTRAARAQASLDQLAA